MASEAPDLGSISLFDFQGVPVAKKRICHGASDLYAILYREAFAAPKPQVLVTSALRRSKRLMPME